MELGEPIVYGHPRYTGSALERSLDVPMVALPGDRDKVKTEMFVCLSHSRENNYCDGEAEIAFMTPK